MSHSFGNDNSQDGVTGDSNTGRGVFGHSGNQAGVAGKSDAFVGVFAETTTSQHPALFAKGPAAAAAFEGDVHIFKSASHQLLPKLFINGIDVEATLQEIELRIRTLELNSQLGDRGPVIKRA